MNECTVAELTLVQMGVRDFDGRMISERELHLLQLIQNNYEKVILTMDRSYINSYEGIKALILMDWLLLLDDRYLM